MKDEIRDRLSALFVEHEKQIQAAAKVRETQQSKEEEFLQAFQNAVDNTIKPAMQEICEMLRANGFQFSIDRVAESYGEKSGIRRAEIKLSIFKEKKEYTPNNQHPHFTVYCDKVHQKFMFHESTISPNRGGHSGGCGEATLETLTKDLLQQKITKTIQDMVQ
jgi:hypothetical protein